MKRRVWYDDKTRIARVRLWLKGGRRLEKGGLLRKCFRITGYDWMGPTGQRQGRGDGGFVLLRDSDFLLVYYRACL